MSVDSREALALYPESESENENENIFFLLLLLLLVMLWGCGPSTSLDTLLPFSNERQNPPRLKR
ncbi:hypothetical protein PT974_08409 [Cladobotryum mycophilum]|uniref:Uncharacterized protein n=1 Tax=Cladobotryum mycophilum TaxID=491253 RepID=A0ABR0SD89_9HYPO